MYRVILNLTATAAMIGLTSIQAQALEVYMFKGAGDFSFVNENMHFSRGLNKMAETLNKEGIRTEVRRFGQIESVLSDIRKRKPKSVAFVGHSMGALASMAAARNLKSQGVEIAYMALLDIPGPVGVAGSNVAWVENYYTINPIYARLTNTRSHPKAENIHIFGYIHNRLDDAPKVQNGILKAIRSVHAAEEQQFVPENQPETLYVESAPVQNPPVIASTASVANVPEDAYSQRLDAANPAAVQPTPQTTQAFQPIEPAQTYEQVAQPRIIDLSAPGDPYALPSIRPSVSVGESATAYSPEQQVPAPVDTVTTSSVVDQSPVENESSLRRRASNFLRRNGRSNSTNARKFQSNR